MSREELREVAAELEAGSETPSRFRVWLVEASKAEPDFGVIEPPADRRLRVSGYRRLAADLLARYDSEVGS